MPVQFNSWHGSDKPFGVFTLAAINAGAGNYLTEDDVQYRSINAEGFVEGGRTTPARGANMEIRNTDDDELYQTQRWGNFSYFIPARQGYYDIVLKMSENHFIEPTDIGKRVFSIEVEGETVVSDLDLVAEVGPLTAYDVTVKNVLVTDFGIDIRATSSLISRQSLQSLCRAAKSSRKARNPKTICFWSKRSR